MDVTSKIIKNVNQLLKILLKQDFLFQFDFSN